MPACDASFPVLPQHQPRPMAQVFLRHMFILRYRLPFPSATATAVMINGLHTASGSAQGVRQVQSVLNVR